MCLFRIIDDDYGPKNKTKDRKKRKKNMKYGHSPFPKFTVKHIDAPWGAVFFQQPAQLHEKPFQDFVSFLPNIRPTNTL